MSISFTIQQPAVLSFTIQQPYGVSFTVPDYRVIRGQSEPYVGPYTVTPSGVAQTLQTNGKQMTDNVTINPIPSNYGLITYNGFEITVS